MATELIISVSGLRGVVGVSLTPEVARRYALAFAGTIPPGPVVLTRDGRESGVLFADVISEALTQAGRDVIDAGPAATPTAGVLVRTLSAAGGIQISASHNPSEYNGLKLFGRDGRIITAAAGAAVIERYRAGDGTSTAADTPTVGDMMSFPIPFMWALVLRFVEVASVKVFVRWAFPKSPFFGAPSATRPVEWPTSCAVTMLT